MKVKVQKIDGKASGDIELNDAALRRVLTFCTGS